MLCCCRLHHVSMFLLLSLYRGLPVCGRTFSVRRTLESSCSTPVTLDGVDSQRSSRSILECSKDCQLASSCRSFFYQRETSNVTSGTCYLSDWVHEISAIPSSPCSYGLRMDIDPGDGTKSCRSDLDCGLEQTYCHDNHCWCLEGYSYSSSQMRCVKDCQALGLSYGDTFQYRLDGAITTNNMACFPASSAKDCEDACVGWEPSCRTMDYCPSFTPSCCLHAVTQWDVPQSYLTPYRTCVFSQRNCL